MTYKAVYFDVDGTLVDDRRRFHPATVAALMALQERGVRRSLATGRTYRSSGPYARAVAADAPLVLYNGAQVVDPASGEVLVGRSLPLPLVRRSLALAGELDLHVNLYVDDQLYIDRVGRRARESMAKDGLEARPVGDLDAFVDREPVKLLLIGPAASCDRFKDELDRRCADDPAPPTVVRSEPEYVEVLGHGVNKGQGLRGACAAGGLDPSEVVAFGDGLNDLELLELAGLGVAPDNAHPEVRRRADRVIGSNDGDAVGAALNEIFHLR